MMKRHNDKALTATAPLVWGGTCYVTTGFMPDGYPMTMAALRGLPSGLRLLFMARQLLHGIRWARTVIPGALNFTQFRTLLFVAAAIRPLANASATTSLVGVSLTEPGAVSALRFISPLSAVLIGFVFVSQSMTFWQIVGSAVAVAAESLWQLPGPSARSLLLFIPQTTLPEGTKQ